MRHLFTALAAITILFTSSCSKSEDPAQPDPDPHTVLVPTKIFATWITVNNIDHTSFAASENIYSINVSVSGTGGVLLAATEDAQTFTGLPTRIRFNQANGFSYNFKTLDLKITARTISGVHDVGSARISLGDYSSDTYPTPKELFFSQNNCAGTLELSYNY